MSKKAGSTYGKRNGQAQGGAILALTRTAETSSIVEHCHWAFCHLGFTAASCLDHWAGLSTVDATFNARSNRALPSPAFLASKHRPTAFTSGENQRSSDPPVAQDLCRNPGSFHASKKTICSTAHITAMCSQSPHRRSPASTMQRGGTIADSWRASTPDLAIAQGHLQHRQLGGRQIDETGNMWSASHNCILDMAPRHLQALE